MPAIPFRDIKGYRIPTPTGLSSLALPLVTLELELELWLTSAALRGGHAYGSATVPVNLGPHPTADTAALAAAEVEPTSKRARRAR